MIGPVYWLTATLGSGLALLAARWLALAEELTPRPPKSRRSGP
jgi:hypothetical protein